MAKHNHSFDKNTVTILLLVVKRAAPHIFHNLYYDFLVGEHMRYNNENVTRIGSMAALNDELYHSLR